MSPETNTNPTKTCPTCGSRIPENAARCLVCGRSFSSSQQSAGTKGVQGPKMPELRLSLPIALGLMAILIIIGAGAVYLVLSGNERIVEPTPTVTLTLTPTITLTPTATNTSTPEPTATPLPPFEYTVKANDTCGLLAAIFNVSTNSIILLNNLSADCTLSVGRTLLIPQPTPTPSPLPTSTQSELESIEEACEKLEYKVNANDTLGGIAANYNVSMEAIKEYNGLTSDIVYSGQPLIIPLCRRNPTPGPTPTATLPPPYIAANLLLPVDGSIFSSSNDVITLQWSSVGTLRANELYAVTIEDVTDVDAKKFTEYVTDTKLIVPSNLRPAGDVPHIFRWWIVPVRQSGTTPDGQPIYDSAGAISAKRVFSWYGGGITTPTP